MAREETLTAAPCLDLSQPTRFYHLPDALNVPREGNSPRAPLRTPPSPVRLQVDMAFDLLSRFRRPGPAPRDARQHPPPRPPPAIARLHTKRPAPVPQVRPQDRRGHHRSLPPVIPRAPAPARKVPARAPARPPPYRGTMRPLQCLHIHFHPSKKREAPPLPPPPAKSSKSSKFSKPSKPPLKAITSQEVPPYPPPRGAMKPPPRHVHWAPAQAPLPSQPYPYPSHTSSRTSSSQSRKLAPQSQPVIPRYQPPRSSHGLMQLPYRSG